ncbi:hypothetical protein BO70DRAFT_324062 [Aspergillus heteromorphus CBS 117.55]|uniref:N-acetyltransferase domain-containing protein n=1 Tax=Aspergillus heteromorphus CBS 117.55 TaxID=1448321 RepID=A0A317UXK9_9EURO|nr:uncharacterized protein BO70DRAFT_324062 [Aspergillus heteromorphus CBS 117.55]PWY66774.1 hypothetical protein BO70DRAFT_324062 [Aspergillus heteromorphus CBS 117.55]
MSSKSSVELIPWDSESPSHVQTLIIQRQHCGWDSELVEPKWRDQQRSGTKCIYWIVLSAKDREIREKLELHFSMYKDEQVVLHDTSSSIRGVLRTPSRDSFHPIGHISLDSVNSDVQDIDLDLPDEGVYWIKTFYVSRALQGQGVGRAAMDLVESMAVDEPLCATTLALDTRQKNTQIEQEKFLSGGQEPGGVTNEEWYARRGYRLIKVVANYYPPPPGYGCQDNRTVFMRKDIE